MLLASLFFPQKLQKKIILMSEKELSDIGVSLENLKIELDSIEKDAVIRMIENSIAEALKKIKKDK